MKSDIREFLLELVKEEAQRDYLCENVNVQYELFMMH